MQSSTVKAVNTGLRRAVRSGPDAPESALPGDGSVLLTVSNLLLATLFQGLVRGVVALPLACPATWSTSRSAPACLQPATFLHAASGRAGEHAAGTTRAATDPDFEYAVDRPWSAAARLGLWFHPPHKVVTGRVARIRWWHRLRSLVLLTAFVVVGGIALATVIGLAVVASGFLLEQAIG